MSISPTTTPRVDSNGIGIHATHSDLRFVIESDSTGVPASNAILTFQVVLPVPVGTSIELNGRLYTASDDPRGQQFMASTHAIAPTAAQIARDLCNRLAMDSVLKYGYLFTCAVDVIGMFAINQGSTWNITPIYTPPSSPLGPLEQVSLNAGADSDDGMGIRNYQVYIDLETNAFLTFPQTLPLSTGWVTQNKQYLDYAKGTNQHVYNLSMFLAATPYRLAPSMNTGFQQTNGLRAYRIRYGERIVPTGNQYRIELEQSVTPVYWACQGALKQTETNDLRPYYLTTPAYLRPWFTRRPDLKAPIHLSAVLHLYYLYYNAAAPAARYHAIDITVTYIDGVDNNLGYFFDGPALEGCISIRVDPDSWNLPAYEVAAGKQIRSYTVTLIESTTPAFTSFNAISVAHQIVVDRKQEKYDPVTLVWQEPLGGFSAFSFTGNRTHNQDINRPAFSRTVEVEGINPELFGTATARVLAQMNCRVTSGMLDLDVAEWLTQSLVLSQRVYVLIPGAKQLQAVVITGSDTTYDNTRMWRSVSVSFTPSIQNKNLSA